MGADTVFCPCAIKTRVTRWDIHRPVASAAAWKSHFCGSHFSPKAKNETHKNRESTALPKAKKTSGMSDRITRAIMIIETGEQRQEQFAGRNCYMIVTLLSLFPLRRDGMLKLVHLEPVIPIRCPMCKNSWYSWFQRWSAPVPPPAGGRHFGGSEIRLVAGRSHRTLGVPASVEKERYPDSSQDSSTAPLMQVCHIKPFHHRVALKGVIL